MSTGSQHQMRYLSEDRRDKIIIEQEKCSVNFIYHGHNDQCNVVDDNRNPEK